MGLSLLFVRRTPRRLSLDSLSILIFVSLHYWDSFPASKLLSLALPCLLVHFAQRKSLSLSCYRRCQSSGRVTRQVDYLVRESFGNSLVDSLVALYAEPPSDKAVDKPLGESLPAILGKWQSLLGGRS